MRYINRSNGFAQQPRMQLHCTKHLALFLVVSVMLILPYLARGQRDSFFVAVPKTARAYQPDSILSILAGANYDTSNVFIAREDTRVAFLRLVRRFNRLLMFAEDGSLIPLHPEGSCVNYDRMIWSLSLNRSDKSSHIDDYLRLLQPLTAGTRDRTKMTAVIVWTFTTGLASDDNPFEWERKLRKRFGNDLNILKVNMDVSAGWSESAKERQLASLQKVLDQVNARTW